MWHFSPDLADLQKCFQSVKSERMFFFNMPLNIKIHNIGNIALKLFQNILKIEVQLLQENLKVKAIATAAPVTT